MNKDRLKIDFWQAFWGFLIIINSIALLSSWYIKDLTNYWYCVIMILYCVVGLYFSTPREEKDE